MKKIGTAFIAVLLSFLVLVGSPKQAEAVEIGIANFIFSVLQVLMDSSATAQQKAEARAMLQNSWSSTIPSGSSYRIQVSGDVLSQAVYDLTQRGIPCQIVANSTLNGYVIRCTGEPRNPATGSYLDPNFTYTNRYFCSGSNQYYIYYSTELPTSYNAGLIRSQLTTVITALQTLNSNVSSILSSLGSAVSARLNDMTSWLGSIDNRLDGMGTVLSTVSTQMTTNNNRLLSIGNSLESVVDLMGHTQYVSGYATNSSGTAFSTVTLPYDIATAYCAYLNANMVGKTVGYLLRDEDSVSSYPTFEYANIESNRIRVHVQYVSGSLGNTYLCSQHHVIYAVGSPNTINLSGNVTATLNDTNIVNALQSIESTLNGMSSGSDPVTQFCIWQTTFTDGTSYPTVTIPYESAVNLVALLNTELQGKRIGYLDRDGETVTGQTLFRSAYLSNGRIMVIRGSYTSGSAYLLTQNHVLIQYSDPVYLGQFTTLHDDLIEHIDSIYDWLDNADLATNTTVTQIVQDYSDSVEDFDSYTSEILKLAKSVFNFGNITPDFIGALQYFNELGRDVE